MARDSLLAFLPTDKVPGPLGPLQDRLLDEVTGRYLHRPTDQVDGAEHQVNLTVSEIFGSQRLILAEADLIVSVRAMEAGTVDKAAVQFVETARRNLGDGYVDALFAASRRRGRRGPAPVRLRTRPCWPGTCHWISSRT